MSKKQKNAKSKHSRKYRSDRNNTMKLIINIQQITRVQIQITILILVKDKLYLGDLENGGGYEDHGFLEWFLLEGFFFFGTRKIIK